MRDIVFSNYELIDSNNRIIPYVCAVDQEFGFYLIYDDIGPNGQLNSLRVKRIYDKFSVRGKTRAIVRIK